MKNALHFILNLASNFAKQGKALHSLRFMAAFVALLLLSGQSWGQLLNENFSYTSATLLTANGWVAHSGGGTNAITVASDSLISYPGYLSSGTGFQVKLTTNGEDDNKAFTSKNSGNLYGGFRVNATWAQTTGDYFAHFGATAGASNTTFAGRIWIKKEGPSSKFAFGISKSSTATNISYTGFNYSLNTTYLVVVKYSFVAGATNDVATLYINPTLNAVEPSATISTLTTDNAIADPTALTSFCLRHGHATAAPLLKLDGINGSNT